MLVATETQAGVVLLREDHIQTTISTDGGGDRHHWRKFGGKMQADGNPRISCGKSSRRRIAAVVGSALVFALALAAPVGASTGQLYAFGSNKYGQLGIAANSGTEAPTATPTLVTVPASSPVVGAAAGGLHSLVVTAAGEVFGFGWNGYGQLGNIDKTQEVNASPRPAEFAAGTGSFAHVAAGRFFSLALSSAGIIYGFGENQFGQLGTTTNNGKPDANPVPESVTLPGAGGPVVQIAAGGGFSLARTSTGQLYAFGENFAGELGNANTGNQPNPVPTQVILPNATGPVVQMAAGAEFTLAVTSTGQLYAFGDNFAGQLGNAVNNSKFVPNPTPTLVPIPAASGGVVQVATGYDFSLALTSSGQLYAFGDNNTGQLGIGAVTSGPSPKPALVTVPGATGPIVQVAAGSSEAFAITASGQLFAWGSNGSGALGLPVTTKETPTPTLVSFPFGTTIDTVGAGPRGSQTLAVTAELAVLTSTLPAGKVGDAYSASAAAAGGLGPYAWSATGLPAGLSINGSGQITGTPTAAGTSTVTLRAADVFGLSASSAAIPLTIVPAVASGPPGGAIPTARTLTAAQIRANLLSQLNVSGKAAKLAALLKSKSFSSSFTALSAGTLTINWYFLPAGAHLSRKAKPKPLLLASGNVGFKAPGKKKVTVKLSGKGLSFLRRKQSVKITIKGSFTPTGQKAITATKTLKLKR